jgi:hypothetical protein
MRTPLLTLLLGIILIALPFKVAAQVPSIPDNPQIICIGSIEPYCVDCPSADPTGTPGSTYDWIFLSGPSIVNIGPNPANPTSNHIQINWGGSTLPGLYVLQVTETSVDGCPGPPRTLNIQVTPELPSLFSPIGPLCLNSSAPALPLTSNNGVTGTWNPSSISTAASGTFTYTFTPDNPAQCARDTFINVVISVQPPPPVVACYETATWNPTNCAWDVTGTQPPAPTGLACYETASFNTTTCAWDVTGTQPPAPTGLACYETASFNTTTCAWDVTGTQPPAPTGLACYETSSFNTTTCAWDVTGTQPPAPTGLACYETASFNTTTCVWDVTGTQPPAPTGLACYETASFNTTTCVWDVTGTQPPAPTGLACYETASFNTTTCVWDVTGTQPPAPTGLACYETASFNTTTCAWDVTGTQPPPPVVACYETTSFNTINCQWDIVSNPFTVNIAAASPICHSDDANISFSNGPSGGTVIFTVNGSPESITLDASGSFSYIISPATIDLSVVVTSVSNGGCIINPTLGTLLITVNPPVNTSPIFHD